MCRKGSARLVCVTQREACRDDFEARMEAIASMPPARLILREKALPPADYRALAERVLAICSRYDVPLTLRYAPEEAPLPGCAVQLPFAAREHAPDTPFGVSIHAVEEAAALRQSHAEYLVAGHIFETACKPGLAPRGLPFLQQVCAAAAQPVYAIGGITPERVPAVLAAGAAGYCVMNALMTCPDPRALIAAYYEKEGVV